MIDTNNSKIGSPFPFRVFCQKVIPLAFDESLSYLELLYSLLHYLKETVIPAVNNNADAVEELQNLYNELKSYVDNYFENLDVQEEINNKLDEMAESGQLAEIISLYLDYNLLQCYNTNAELKQSTSLNNGSFARTYGKLTYNDGYGAFYKIRQRTNQDEPDDDNLIVLVNTENLVAEKMVNQYLNDTKINLEYQINLLKNERIICIGDSYGVGTTYGGQTTGWCDRLKNLMNLSNNDYFKFVEGGCGFLKYGEQGHTFLSLLQNNMENIQNKQTITKIICCGGFNDNLYGSSDLNVAIQNFCNYCNQNFENAKIYIGMVGSCKENTQNGANIRTALGDEVLRGYQNCVRYGAYYLNGIENLLHDYRNFMSNDNIHPTNLGYEFLSSYLFNTIKTGYADYKSQLAYSNINFTDSSNATNFRIASRLHNDIVELLIGDCKVEFSNPKTIRDSIVLGTIDIACFRSSNRNAVIPIKFYLQTTSNTFFGGYGNLRLNSDGTISLIVGLLLNDGDAFVEVNNVKSIIFYNTSFVFPTSDC